MIIDSHMHIGEMLNFFITEDTVLGAMEKYRIDFGIVSNIEANEFDHNLEIIAGECQISQKHANARTLNLVKNNKDKLKGLFWIKPFNEDYEIWIEEFLVENREFFCGIKMHPFHSMMKPTDEKVRPYIQLAEKMGLSFAVHTAMDTYSDPYNVYEIAVKYPNVNFIMVHMGLMTGNERAIYLIEKLPNLYGDTAWVKTESVLKAIERCGSNKILFGTDAPIGGIDTYGNYMEMIDILKAKLTQTDYENVMFKNAVRVFGLPIIQL